MKQNVTWREPPKVKVDGCFYSGNVLGEPGSAVTVSLCNGIVSILLFELLSSSLVFVCLMLRFSQLLKQLIIYNIIKAYLVLICIVHR